jgi:hypothetical protein
MDSLVVPEDWLTCVMVSMDGSLVAMDTPSMHKWAKIILNLWNALTDGPVVMTDYLPKQVVLSFI